MAVASWLQRILACHSLPYEEHRHPAVFHAKTAAEAERLSDYRAAKTVFLSANGRPVGIVVPEDAEVDLARVEAVLGCAPLRFASESELSHWFKGCQTETVPPLRLRRDQCLLMDRSLAGLKKMIWPAGSQEHAVAVRFRDWYRAVRPGVGHFAVPTNGTAAKSAPVVLVVEDEVGTNELFCRLLEREGFNCRGALEGAQALSVASQVRPSAILLDLMLPDMSGFELYERLRRAGPMRRTPVIIVSALGDEASRRRGQQLGADAYLTKPFLPAKLVAEVNAVLADAQG